MYTDILTLYEIIDTITRYITRYISNYTVNLSPLRPMGAVHYCLLQLEIQQTRRNVTTLLKSMTAVTVKPRLPYVPYLFEFGHPVPMPNFERMP